MALLKCPQCSGSISSTVEKCIHCGYTFKVCPSCQAVIDSNARFCSECGSPIEAVAAPFADQPLNESIETDHTEKSERPKFPPLEELVSKIKKPGGYYVFKTFNIISIVFGIISLVIFFLSLIIGVLLIKSVYDLGNLIGVVVNVFICSIWFGFADIWMNIGNLFVIRGIRNWSAKNDINLADVIKSGMNDFSIDQADRDKNMALFAYAYRIETGSPSPVKPIILSILKLVNSFASIIMYVPILFLNVNILFSHPFNLSGFIGLPLLIFAIIVSIGFSIAINILKSNIRKGMNKHIQAIVPSRYEFNYD